jgi:hypothetical protein
MEALYSSRASISTGINVFKAIYRASTMAIFRAMVVGRARFGITCGECLFAGHHHSSNFH